MRKILSFSVLSLTMGFIGCASKGRSDIGSESSVFDGLPFVYKMTVQQGNILTEEMVQGLQLGMSKRQVRFLLGTPLLTDIFHPDRWDYTYTIRRGEEPMEIRKLTLFFEDEALAGIEGDVGRDPEPASADAERQLIVSVPDWEDRRGLLRRVLEGVGLEPAN